MKKIRLFAIGLIAVVISYICGISVLLANIDNNSDNISYAEEVVEQQEETSQNGSVETIDETEEENDESDLINIVICMLKEQYGEDYQTYYDLIIEQYGSIKNYVQSKIEDGTLTDGTATAWNIFVKWLDSYASIWAPILAVIGVVVVLLLSKKLYSAVKSLFLKVFKGSNQQQTALLAIIAALEKQLGTAEKTAEERAMLEKAKEELTKNE